MPVHDKGRSLIQKHPCTAGLVLSILSFQMKKIFLRSIKRIQYYNACKSYNFCIAPS